MLQRKYFKPIILLIIIATTSGCASIKYNGSERFIKHIDYPTVGIVQTAYIGDKLVEKGSLV